MFCAFGRIITKCAKVPWVFRDFCRKSKQMKRLIPKSRFSHQPKTVDSVKSRIKREGKKYNLPLLMEAKEAWEGLSDFRKERLRNLRYVYGDQLGDYVQDEKGKWVTERERISKRTGGVALQNNHLYKIVQTLMGLYSKSATQPVCFARQKDADIKSKMMSNALKANWDNNYMRDLMTEEMRELICGGVSVVREQWGVHDSVEDSYTYPVLPSMFFYEAKNTDIRMWDVCLIGEIKDYTLGELASELAESEYDYQQLEHIYRPHMQRYATRNSQTKQYESDSWDTPPQNNLCRVYHVWTLEHKPRYRCVDIMDRENPMYRIELSDKPQIDAINAERIQMGLSEGMTMDEIPLIETKYIIDQYWHYQMLSPDGLILDEYDSPYDHKGHPYSLTVFNLVNGDIVPFISVIRDQQRYINRLITLNDLAISSSIKGLKMIPKDAVPKNMTEREFAERATELGGWIFYEPSQHGNVPQVITSNSTNIGTAEMLQLQIGFINDLSSVSEALQGKSTNGAASRYMMETQNSTTSISAFLMNFSTFERRVAEKKMKVIHQYYTEPRNISVARSGGYAELAEYDPKAVEDIQFFIAVKETAESPVNRMMINDVVKEIWAAGQLSAEQMLEHSYYPGSEELLQALRANRENAEQQAQMTQLPNVQGANMNAVQNIQNALRNG